MALGGLKFTSSEKETEGVTEYVNLRLRKTTNVPK
jgi:hypothetical protein